jgi:hypothetical protein
MIKRAVLWMVAGLLLQTGCEAQSVGATWVTPSAR